ncbi:Arginase/deacetylase [Hortaea werneckii]|uniref:Histone deacetylase domain-containing protein n=1 Tax=Hortaea werneckii TaxID=91943 RepID=A0A3M7IQN5_HORWE|nr:Arginase/deacetylase [Hortaea werneckii]KAI6815169.1 Arginase/deacetylase [Hortaea werneckii]KAI6915781.1 Arginase/deacetylase [Hortaea werneckii]KAI6928731.1 Arginase/deacetylase [Hortaea werneckii]KAI6962693.1 Arginase/deacetylase [Hortaea werneckii]
MDPPSQGSNASSIPHKEVQPRPRQASLTSTASSPGPANTNTPKSRRPSQPASSANTTHHNQNAALSPQPHTVRRASSAMSVGHGSRGTPSPNLSKRSSRQSLTPRRDDDAADRRPTPKRSISNLISNLREAQSTMESIEEPPPPLTPQQVAVQHFARELAAHGQEGGGEAETMVILHDACYGHRFSRLKTSKSLLSMIVERPERIHASILGASAAYVRLGGHHVGGRSAPQQDSTEPVGPPPFKIRRTSREMDVASPYVTSVHGTDWMKELRTLCNNAGEKLANHSSELERPITSAFQEEEKRHLHSGDLYLCPESLSAFQGALGGVADAVDAIFQDNPTKRAFVAVRPPGHHCSADHPSGFCWLNNVHVGIEYAAQTQGLTHAAILDIDLHHGDGSQAITWERNRAVAFDRERLRAKPNTKGLKVGPDIGYFSLHDINSYPCEMGDDEKVQAASLCLESAHGQSVWNVHLQPWKTEEEFWALYESRYSMLLEKARGFLRRQTQRWKVEGRGVQPKAAIFISAGFDASEWEGEGMQRHKVNVPTEFYARFTRDVVEIAQEEDSACDGRVVSVLEGGYSDRALCSGVLSHLSGLCSSLEDQAKQVAEKLNENGGQGAGLDEMMGSLQIGGTALARQAPSKYDTAWWSPANLTALENYINPPPPPPPGKKIRTGPQPTYATPTESFAYKVVDPNKFARSISGTFREVSADGSPRPPQPPPLEPQSQELDWILATHELSKLLIPIDRQTKSCTAAELGGVRTKKERQSAMPALPSGSAEDAAGKPRQLRDRKAKVPARYAESRASVHSDELTSVPSRSASRASQGEDRRRTMHELPSASAPEAGDVDSKQRRLSRRSSAGSALNGMDGIIEGNEATPPMPALPSTVRTGSGNATTKAPSATSGVGVKKTRAPAAANGPAAKPTTSRPSTSSSTSTTTASRKATPPASLPAEGNPLPVPLPQPTREGAGGDMDRLANGMKRITLKGPRGTREEHDRKVKEREAAQRRERALKGAETRRVNAAARKAAATGTTSASAPVSAKETVPAQSAMAGATQQGAGDDDTLHHGSGMRSATTPNEAKEVPTPVQVPHTQMASNQHNPAVDNAMEGAIEDMSARPGIVPQGQQPDLHNAAAMKSPTAEAEQIFPPHQMPSNPDPQNGISRPRTVEEPPPTLMDTIAPPADDRLPPPPPASDGLPSAPPPEALAPEPTTAKKVPSQHAMPVVPDSAARQLMQENVLAQGGTTGLQHQQQQQQRRLWDDDPSFRASTPASPSVRPSSSSFAAARSGVDQKHQLPVWSSTGPIPFGSRTGDPAAAAHTGESASAPAAAQTTAVVSSEGGAAAKAAEARDIWAVPKTPGR